MKSISVTVEEHIRGDTHWVAVRARGAEWSWLTPAEAAELGRLWVEKSGFAQRVILFLLRPSDIPGSCLPRDGGIGVVADGHSALRIRRASTAANSHLHRPAPEYIHRLIDRSAHRGHG